MTQTEPSSKWADLAPRVLSAVAMAAIAAMAIYLGGLAYLAMIAIVIGLCIWEFTRLLSKETTSLPLVFGIAAAICIVVAGFGLKQAVAPGVLFTPKLAILFLLPVVGAVLIPSNRVLFLLYSLVIMLAGLGFLAMGPSILLIWVVLIIIVSDVAGYFVGRLVGGPKFWPRVSPKKTWSGTIAGWVGALVLGLVGASLGVFSFSESLLTPLLAFSGQMGDIVESAIKRKMDVKDSSNLIPGHGGFLDRFDAMIGASSALVVLSGIATLVFSA